MRAVSSLIMTEFSRYNVLKEAVRAKVTRQPSRPDVEKIRKDVRSEVEEEFQKTISTLTAFYVIGFESIRIHPSTRYQIRCGFIFFHSGVRISLFSGFAVEFAEALHINGLRRKPKR